MTRADIERDYKIRDGRIVSPGKFEGERIYVPYFWDAYLNGMMDDNGRYIWCEISPEERAMFPEIPKRKRNIRLVTTGAGFVCEV